MILVDDRLSLPFFCKFLGMVDVDDDDDDDDGNK